MRTPLPWREGFARIDAHLADVGRERHALCGIQLRSPVPFTVAGFIEFNVGYCDLVTTVDVYTVLLLEGLLEDAVLPTIGPATRRGLVWSRSRPPVQGLDFEMDMRGVRSEIAL